MIAYCTQFSIHAPGRGLPYKLAPLKGKQAPAISALLSRGTLQNIAPSTLNADSWRIQAGLPLKQWPSQDQALIHKLIPECKKGLEGDYLQQIENTYNQYRLVPGIPSFNDLLGQSGASGQLVLQLRQARQVLSNQTISAERLPDMLYEPTGDGLPRVLPASKDSSPSLWAEVKPGIFARFTVIEGNLGRNLFEFRVTPKAIAAINNSDTVATKDLDKNLQVSNTTNQAVVTLAKIFDYGVDGVLFIGYVIGRAAQALISVIIPDAKADGEISNNCPFDEGEPLNEKTKAAVKEEQSIRTQIGKQAAEQGKNNKRPKDCSGWIRNLFKPFEIPLPPGRSNTWAEWFKNHPQSWESVPNNGNLQAGDLIVITRPGEQYGHVLIVGDDVVVYAASYPNRRPTETDIDPSKPLSSQLYNGNPTIWRSIK